MNPAPWMCPFFAPVKAMMTTSSLASRIWKSFPLGITLWTSLPHISPACLYQPSTSLSGFSLIFIGYSFYYRTIKLVFFLSVPLYSHLSAGEYCIFIKCLFSNLSGMYSTLRTRVTEGHQGSVLKKSLNVNAFSCLAGFLILVCYLLQPCRCLRLRFTLDC